jgi:two-component system, OmpR family, sensor histidine kinase CiaH
MSFYKNRRLMFIKIGHWLILGYVIAALIWWYIALQQQNTKMAALRMQALEKNEPAYQQQAAEIANEAKRKNAQYIGEGSIFLLLIMAGVWFVYRSVRKQLAAGQQQQNFLMAVTHELKTPLAITKLNLETMQRRKLDEAQQSKIIQTTLHEANRLNELINNILYASQFEHGLELKNAENVNLSNLVNEIVEEHALRYPNSKLELDVEEEVVVRGEPLLLRLVVSNLLENAIKYGSKEKRVWVNLRQAPAATLEVKDDGPGIADAEKEKIFHKFYRVGNEQTRTSKGTGLGLYLARKIAEAHHADIYVTNNTPSGATFTVQFT